MHVGLGHDLEQKSRKPRIHFNELTKGWSTYVGGAVDEYELQEPRVEQLADVSEAREKDNTGESRRVKTQNLVKGSTRRCFPRTRTSEGKPKAWRWRVVGKQRTSEVASKSPLQHIEHAGKRENETQTSTQKMIISKMLERPVNGGGSDVGAVCGEIRLGSCCSRVSPRMKNRFTPIRSKEVFTVRPKVTLR